MEIMCKVWKYNLPQQKRFYPNLLKWVKEMTAIYSSPWENIILRKNLLFNSRFCIQISNQLSLTNLKMILKNQIIILTQIGAETINLQSISHHLIYQRHTKLFRQTKFSHTLPIHRSQSTSQSQTPESSFQPFNIHAHQKSQHVEMKLNSQTDFLSLFQSKQIELYNNHHIFSNFAKVS